MAKKRTAIPRAQWLVTVQLEVGTTDDDKNDKHEDSGKIKPHVPGTPIGDPLVLRYADSYLAGQPENVGWLIGQLIEDRAVALKALARKAKK